MGEAKRRGTYQERLEQAIVRNEQEEIQREQEYQARLRASIERRAAFGKRVKEENLRRRRTVRIERVGVIDHKD